MISFLPIIIMALGAGEDEDQARLTRPSLVVLDFRDQPVPDVVKAIRERSGNDLELINSESPHWRDQRITLESPEPLPFWEAVDRLCAATRLQRNVFEFGLFGSPRAHIQLHQGLRAGNDGPAKYVGPFRLGEFSLHSRHDMDYVPVPAAPTIANDAGTLYAEFKVQTEPRLVAHRSGPLARLVAEDEKGQSLLDPSIAEHGPPLPSFGYQLGLIRVPLVRPAQPGTTLKRLHGVIPVEIGVRSAEPPLSIPLAGSAGKTFRAGDVAFQVFESEVNEQGTTRFRLTVRLEGERNDLTKVPSGLVHARLMDLHRHQIEIVDEEGKPVGVSGGSHTHRNELTLTYTISALPSRPRAHPPTRFRYYALTETSWEVPFEFGDLPLP